MTAPVLLAPNGVERFYLGGPAIAALRGVTVTGDHVPEDWVGSTTEVFGVPGLGLSRLPDGRLLREAISADTAGWLGQGHVARWGAEPALLVKLLDSGERLPVHVHPDDAFALAHIGTPFGKTEAWVVVGGSGEVHLGWREDMTEGRIRDLVAAQDVDAMRAALHRLDVASGDSVFVPAGVPHSIGAGLLIVELQQPSDLGVMLEWKGTGVGSEQEATLGLGWEVALQSVECDARDPRPLAGPADNGAPLSRALPEAADRFFAADWLRASSSTPSVLDAGFSVIVVLDGDGTLEAVGGEGLFLSRGDTVVIPHGAGDCKLTGDIRALRCRPPRDFNSEANRRPQA